MVDTELKIRIKPELLSAAGGQISNIKGQAKGAAAGGGVVSALQGIPGVSAVSKMMPAIGTGMAGIGLIAGGIGLIVKAVMNIKPLMNMISAIIKILTLVLRPIADVIITLLMPVLFVLKPILMVANQLIAPYRRLAFQMLAAGGQMMQEGDVGGAAKAFTGAAMTMFAGISTFLIGIFSSVIKMAMSGLAELLKAVTGGLIRGIGSLLSFIPGVGDAIQEGANKAADFIESGIDFVVGKAHQAVDVAGTILTLANATMIAKMAETLGVATDEQLAQFVTGVGESLKSVFGGSQTDVIIDTWTEKMLTNLELMDTKVIEKLQEMEKNWTTAVAQGTSEGAEKGAEEAGAEQEKEQTGFWAKVLAGLKLGIQAMIDPIGMAIDVWKFGLIGTFEKVISGESGLLSATTKEFLGFTNRQDEIVSPIRALVERFAAEVRAFNAIQVRNVSVSGSQRRFSRSR